MADAEEARIVSLNELSEKVDRLFGMLEHKEARTAVKSGTAADLSEQINKAVNEATAAEKAKSAEEQHRKGLEDRLAALEARKESKPKEYSRLTRFMWGGDDE